MKEKAILLLHGFKRNGVDDFGYLTEYFEKYSDNFDIYNEIYFDNYDKNSIKRSHLDVEIDRITENLKDYKEVIMVAYSTGSIVASLVSEKLPGDTKVKIWAAVPPIKIHLAKWVPLGWRNMRKASALKKKIGKERYLQLKQKQQESRNMEKYPVRITIFINNLRLLDRKTLFRNPNIKFLLSSTDAHVKTSAIVKKLNKHNKRYNIKEFNHENILNSQRDIFIEWLESNNFTN